MDGLISGKGLKPGGALKVGFYGILKLWNIFRCFWNRATLFICLWGGGGGEPRGPYSQILMTGGSDRGSYFVPKKSQLQNLSTQKNHYFFGILPKIP